MPFEIGMIVSLRADPTRKGPVVTDLGPVAGVIRYRVFHGPGDTREYLEDQLELDGPSPPASPFMDALVGDEALSAGHFRAQLTAARLRHPATDHIYSLYAARIRRVPFQLKPLLRFMRAERPRLLIADEVGVGKTIEAGLILKELDTRRRLDCVLILCPKSLVAKWVAEMRRFDERFRPLNSELLRYCIRETHLDGSWPQEHGRAIVNLELLRRDEIMHGRSGSRRHRRSPGLLQLDPPPLFDLVIVDEAHHLRTPGTNAHAIARFLCDNAEAVLFLSATPLHLGSSNLFALLELLRPDLFQSPAVFREMLEPNRHLTRAMRHVRTRQPSDSWRASALEELSQAAGTSWGGRVLEPDLRLGSWRERLALEEDWSDERRIRCLRDLEELHSLAHVMNRTRRRDIGPFTVREPVTVPVDFSPHEQALYDSVVQLRRAIVTQTHDATIAALVSDTLERQAASCLHALGPLITQITTDGRLLAADIGEGLEEDEDFAELPADFIQNADALRRLADDLPEEDRKLDRLMAIVTDTLEVEGPRKLLVFSYFLHSIDYLAKHLQSAGVRTAVVTGRTPEVERESSRNRFRRPHGDADAIDVLVSSEVGCEGLDYEFCSRIVNWDIPWNPMRIEQRIGRIDRFGQQSPKIQIFNFVRPGTVEDRIYFRCFQRLGIFHDTVGDTEEVLGRLTADLHSLLADSNLSAQQQELRAQQLTDNLLRELEEQRRLEAEGGAVVGLDALIAGDAQAVVDEERFVSPTSLRELVHVFVMQPPLGGGLTPSADNENIDRLRLNAEAREILKQQIRATEWRDHQTLRFRRWLEGRDPNLLVTFDQETAIERRDLPFVTPVHPLVRLAVEKLPSADSPVTRLRVRATDLPTDAFVFTFDLWESIGLVSELRLVPSVRSISNPTCACPEVGQRLQQLLSVAVPSAQCRSVEGASIALALSSLDETADAERRAAVHDLRQRDVELAARRRAHIEAHYSSRLRQVAGEIDAASDTRIRRMKGAERDRLLVSRDAQLRAIDGRRPADVVTRRLAAGILEITHAD